MVSLQKCTVHATWSLKSWKYTPVSPTASHPSHMSRLTGSDRSPLYQQTPHPVLPDVPRTLPVPTLRTPSSEQLHRRPMNAKPWPIWPIRIFSASSFVYRSEFAKFWRCSAIFRYQYLKVYRNFINTRSSVEDVIQGFAQKAVRLSCVVHIMQCVKLNTVIINNKNLKKDKTPINSP